MECRPPADGLPEELPVLALREFVVFPYMVLPLFVARERSIARLEFIRTKLGDEPLEPLTVQYA